MGEVLDLDVSTVGDIPADKVLTAALSEGLSDVLVIGHDRDGGFYIASSSGGIADNLLLVELARAELIENARA